MSARLALPQVTLCAATSVNLAATVQAMAHCLNLADFGRAVLFSHSVPPGLPQGLEHVTIAPLCSSADYSRFMLSELAPHIDTSHCLIVQWDGFILDADAWEPAFLDCDYIGAPWPQFTDGHDVGNGGFSLRSRRLLDACCAPGFVFTAEPEDVVIARRNRLWLETDQKLRFADRALASRFSFERDRTAARSFGFHGVFNLPDAIGTDGFWQIYRELDDKRTVWTDFGLLGVRLAGSGQKGIRRTLRFLADRICFALQRYKRSADKRT